MITDSRGLPWFLNAGNSLAVELPGDPELREAMLSETERVSREVDEISRWINEAISNGRTPTRKELNGQYERLHALESSPAAPCGILTHPREMLLYLERWVCLEEARLQKANDLRKANVARLHAARVKELAEAYGWSARPGDLPP